MKALDCNTDSTQSIKDYTHSPNAFPAERHNSIEIPRNPGIIDEDENQKPIKTNRSTYKYNLYNPKDKPSPSYMNYSPQFTSRFMQNPDQSPAPHF